MNLRSRLLVLIAWHAGALLVFLAAVAIALELPPMAWGRMQAMDAWSLGLAYLFAAAVPSIGFLTGRTPRPSHVVAFGAVAFLFAWPLGPVLAGDWPWLPRFLHLFSEPGRLEWRMPGLRVAALAALAMLLNLGLVRPGRHGRRQAWLLAASLPALALLVLPGPFSALYRGLDQPVLLEARTTQFPVRISYYRGRVPVPKVPGGGLQAAGGRLLLVTGEGRFYTLETRPAGPGLEVMALPYRAPLNASEFHRDTPELPPRHHRRFRVMDLLLTEDEGTGGELLVSHHHWNAARACHSVRISMFEGDSTAFLDGRAPEHWRTLWETADCLGVNQDGEPFFSGHQAGGSLLQDGEHGLLLALGDQGFDGVQTERAVSQDPASEFGKVNRIERRDGRFRTYAWGLRSPGSLYRDRQGRVWLVDHGPRGGDELNRLADGANFGWPCRSLGARYGGFEWHPPALAACARPLTEPAFAWIPSIGTAALIGPEGPGFEPWRGDFLVGGLASRGLAHVVRVDGRPVLSEPIPLDERVRDLVEDGYGRIVLWTDSGALIALEAGDSSERF